MDSPGEARRVHDTATPRSGGIAIIGGSLVASIVWLDYGSMQGHLVLSLLLIVIFGLMDDLLDLGYRSKLLGQVLAASLFLLGHGGVANLPFFPLGSTPTELSLAVSFVFLIGITNAINLSDGLDGLAAGNSLLSLGLISLFAFQLGEINFMVIALAVAGGLVGFLRFNTHPATIFMGDLGSQFIGFIAGALALALFANEGFAASPAIIVLLFGLPILDTLTVIVLRLLKHRPIFAADRSHLHHQFLRLGFRHYEVVAVMYVLQAICVGLAYELRFVPDWQIFCAYLIICLSILSFIAACRYFGITVRAEVSARALGQERRNRWLRKLDWYHHNTARVISAGIAFLFLSVVYASLSMGVDTSLSRWVVAAPLILGVCLAFYPNHRYATSRVICYLGSAAVIYLSVFGSHSADLLHAVDLYVGSLLVLLMLAIRITRREVFRLDTQDYLVVMLVAFTPLVVPYGTDDVVVVRTVLYLAVIFYACEYVLTKGNQTKWVVNIASLISLFSIAAT